MTKPILKITEPCRILRLIADKLESGEFILDTFDHFPDVSQNLATTRTPRHSVGIIKYHRKVPKRFISDAFTEIALGANHA